VKRPPFGGFSPRKTRTSPDIFVSPGPINEPATAARPRRTRLRHGVCRRRPRSGRSRAQHLVLSPGAAPACCSTRACARPAPRCYPDGTGGSELQAKLVIDLGVTCICASTAFFVTLAEAIEAMGHALPGGWKVKIGAARRRDGRLARQTPPTGGEIRHTARSRSTRPRTSA